MARKIPATSSATSDRTRAARRSVSSRRTKLSSGGRLRRTSRCGKGNSSTCCPGCASRRSSVAGVVAISSPAPTNKSAQSHGKPHCMGELVLKVSTLVPRPDEVFDARLLDRQLEPVAQLDLRLPAEDLLGQADVRLADLGIVDRQRLEDDLGLRAGDLDHGLGELEQRELVRVADVDRMVIARLG